jgi:hypothetical protein
MRAEDIFHYSGIEKRASKVVYRQFGINRHELNMLVGLCAFMGLKGKKIISRDLFTQWLGLNYGLQRRCYAYMRGLIDKGCLYRLAYRRPDGNSLAISPYGIKILQAFDSALITIMKEDKFKGSYQSTVFDPDNMPDGYKIMQHGRI